jgi:hypothetical protein
LVARKQKSPKCPACGHQWHPPGQKCNRWKFGSSSDMPDDADLGFFFCQCTGQYLAGRAGLAEPPEG